jgi:predicted  nucleic acid-binding Zn-ribbon protein
MRWFRPRFTITSAMIAIAAVSFVLTAFVTLREQRRRMAAVEAALAEYQRAKATLDMSDIAFTEYLEGVSKHMLERAQSEVDLVEAELKRACDRLGSSRSTPRKDDRSGTEDAAAKRNVESLEARLAQARNRLAELGDRKDQTVKALQSELEWAQAHEAAMKATYEKLRDSRR